jgi:hypothetical protein
VKKLMEDGKALECAGSRVRLKLNRGLSAHRMDSKPYAARRERLRSTGYA